MTDHDPIKAAAWDEGFETAARCYWRKPRNPYSDEMNDDVEDYCAAHGGEATSLECHDLSHKEEQLEHFRNQPFQAVQRPLDVQITMPMIQASRTGIQFGTNWKGLNR